MPMGQSWFAVPLCGIAGDFMGGLFSKITILGSRFLERTGIAIVVIAIVCGGIIAIVKYVSDSATTGIGNQQTQVYCTVYRHGPFLSMHCVAPIRLI
jgi:fucose permease